MSRSVVRKPTKVKCKGQALLRNDPQGLPREGTKREQMKSSQKFGLKVDVIKCWMLVMVWNQRISFLDPGRMILSVEFGLN